ncbi:DUF4163 domain-containing protein [bacterium]|nr:DUF4163 domain-containing protein [bacterium]
MKRKKCIILLFICIFLFSCCNKALVERPILQEKTLEKKNHSNNQPASLDNVSGDKIRWTGWEYEPFKVNTELWFEENQSERGQYTVKGSYPVITGFEDHTIEILVNQSIKSAILEEVKKLSREWINQYTFLFSYRIMLLHESNVSILLEYHVNIGGSHGYDRAKAVNIDLKKKKVLQDDELFYPNSHYWEVIKPIFKREFEQQFHGNITLNENRLDFSIMHPDLSFVFTPVNLTIVYGENETDSRFSSRVYIDIPLNKLSNITPYKELENAYSYQTALENWEVVENRNDIHNDLNQGFIIKYPVEKDEDGIILDMHRISFHDILIDISFSENALPIQPNDDLHSFDTVKASILIQWRDIDGSENLVNKTKLDLAATKPRTDNKYSHWESEQINRIWFEKSWDREICSYRGIVNGTEYQITITLPQKETKELEEIITSRINQILGTFRFF